MGLSWAIMGNVFKLWYNASGQFMTDSLWFICHRISLCGRHVGYFPGSQLVLEQIQAACKLSLELEGISRQFLNRTNPKVLTLRPPSNIFPNEKRTTSKAMYQTTGVWGGELERGERHPTKLRMECCQQKLLAIELQTLVVTQQSRSLWAEFALRLAGVEREKQHHFYWEAWFSIFKLPFLSQLWCLLSKEEFWLALRPNSSNWSPKPLAAATGTDSKIQPSSSETGRIRMAEGASTFLNCFSPSLMEI